MLVVARDHTVNYKRLDQSKNVVGQSLIPYFPDDRQKLIVASYSRVVDHERIQARPSCPNNKRLLPVRRAAYLFSFVLTYNAFHQSKDFGHRCCIVPGITLVLVY
jgi:hypothetical protein